MAELLIIVGVYLFGTSVLWANKVTYITETAVLIRMAIGSLLMFAGLYYGDSLMLVKYIAGMEWAR